MRALSVALLMSFLVAGPTTAFAQLPCNSCQAPTVSSPPAAYYYSVPYAAPTYYVYAQPVYYVPAVYYVPVAAKCDAPAPAKDPLPDKPEELVLPEAVPFAKAAAASATYGQTRVYRRVLDSSGRLVSGSQFMRSGVSTDHASMLASGFRLVDQYQTSNLEDPAVSAARAARLNASVSNAVANVIQAEAQKIVAKQAAAPAAKTPAVKAPAAKTPAAKAAPHQDDCAAKIDKLTKSIEALQKQVASIPPKAIPPKAIPVK